MIEDELCAVAGCDQRGRRQVCLYDGRYHWHGRIHYENGHPANPPDISFKPLADEGWLGICADHYTAIRAAFQTYQANRRGIAPEAELEKRAAWGDR